jgi:hypothetical protein
VVLGTDKRDFTQIIADDEKTLRSAVKLPKKSRKGWSTSTAEF